MLSTEEIYQKWREEVVRQEYNGLFHLFDKKVIRYNSW